MKFSWKLTVVTLVRVMQGEPALQSCREDANMAQEESHFKLWQRKQTHRQMCHHSACSLDLMHNVKGSYFSRIMKPLWILSCYCFYICLSSDNTAEDITSLGDGQILRTDHDVALPGEDGNSGGIEKKTKAEHAAVGIGVFRAGLRHKQTKGLLGATRGPPIECCFFLLNIHRRSHLGSRSSEWAQPSPHAFAMEIHKQHGSDNG
ncbi:uncharacterized protein LOC114567547 [Perca flavescens]|uniref:uncharacterized protein LOC114567547 n=1 Tax=Perca flavescens TaxID=8167 RepID=UPI00106EFBCB|nr:uncharacterized protein LOC114567547 [Perca flavescens]